MPQDKLVYEFGPYRIDRAERLLRRGHDVVPLPPKAVDVLLALVERGGEIVEKDDLLCIVWPNTFVEEGSLAVNVSLLRRTLGESPSGPYIATVAKRGYRFVAAVQTVQTVREDHAGPRSLAVLPLANLSGDPSQDFFADGMTDELITSLTSIEALRVASRTSIMAYKHTSKQFRQVATELGADWVVEGAVLRAGRKVRITARLVESSTESMVWAETYERDVTDVLDLQSEVANEITERIRVRLTASERERLTKHRRVDPAAYDAYLRARYFCNKRTRDDLTRANGYFRSAIDLDPTYAPAYAGLADTYALLGTIGFDAMPPQDAMPRARAAALRALEIDGGMAEAHASLGYVRLSYEWDWAGAEQEFRRSIACNSAYPAAHHWYGHCFFAMGRLDDGAARMREALQLDPLSIPYNLGIGWSLYYRRQFDDAIAQHRRTLEMAPGLPMVLYELGLACQNAGRHNEALAIFEQAHALSGGEAAAVMLLGQLHGMLGQRADANRHLAALEEMSRRQYVPALYKAFVCTGAGDAEQAFAWFQQAYEERCNYLIYLAVEPTLDRLRPDARFEDLMRCVGLRNHSSRMRR